MMSPSEQAATLNLLAGLELAKKRHIVVQTHKSAGNKSDFYPAGVNVDPSLTRGSSTQHFSAI